MVSDNVKTERIGKNLVSLREKAKSLPDKPGCYLMKRGDGTILYIGKAKNLRKRVGSYFSNSAKTPKTEILVGHIRDFDFILTETDAEAFVLENNLIKKHSPKYNIMLRDDKSYPYVVVNFNEPFPRLQYERRVKRKKGVDVFGPFVHGTNISEVMRVITKSFQLRDCTLREFNQRKEACLLYQIKQCSAPCVDYISSSNYDIQLNYALNFFKGKSKKSLKILEDRMMAHAENEEFEQAAIIRDHINLLKDFSEKSLQENAELDGEEKNLDIIAYYVGEVEVEISIYMVRNGILLGHKNFHFPVIDSLDDIEDEVVNFIYQYYLTTFDSLPDWCVTNFKKEKQELVEDVFKKEFKIKTRTPGRKFKSMMELTYDHAKETQQFRLKGQESVFVGLNKLKDLLSLRERPVLLECYDVAIFQGSSPTASQITFRDGRPDKSRYRHYALKERPEGNNDFEMMKEVLTRRIKHGDLPDVFIVDGGKGQVSIFQGVLKDFELDIPVVGIAKAKAKGSEKTEERLIIPGRANPYYLAKNKSLFRIVVQMRDEAHRFSRRLHHKHEKKKLFKSWIDEVSGVGPKTKKEIRENLSYTRAEIELMSLEELIEKLKIKKGVAQKILDHFKNLIN